MAMIDCGLTESLECVCGSLFLEAHQYLLKGDRKEALRKAAEAVDVNPEDSHGYVIASLAYRSVGDLENAIGYARQAVACDLVDQSAYICYIETAILAGVTEEVKTLVHQLVNTKPVNDKILALSLLISIGESTLPISELIHIKRLPGDSVVDYLLDFVDELGQHKKYYQGFRLLELAQISKPEKREDVAKLRDYLGRYSAGKLGDMQLGGCQYRGAQ